MPSALHDRLVSSSARPSSQQKVWVKAKRGSEAICIAVPTASRATFDTVRQVVAGVLTSPRDACVEVHLIAVVLCTPNTLMESMTRAAEQMDRRFESELLLLPSYCSWAMHVVPVLKPSFSWRQSNKLLAAAFCKKSLQLGAVEVVATGVDSRGGFTQMMQGKALPQLIVCFSSVPVCLIHHGVAHQQPGLAQEDGLQLLSSGANLDAAGHFLKSSKAQAAARCAAPPGGVCNAPSCPVCSHKRKRSGSFHSQRSQRQ